MLRQEKRVRQIFWCFSCLLPKSKLPIQVYYLRYKFWLWDQNQGFSKTIFRFRPWNMDFDHFDITPSTAECVRDEKSTYCELTWHRSRVNPRERKYGNQINSMLKLSKLLVQIWTKKNPCAPTCPQLWMNFPINISLKHYRFSKFGMLFLI